MVDMVCSTFFGAVGWVGHASEDKGIRGGVEEDVGRTYHRGNDD
jgi:hypothetical protein